MPCVVLSQGQTDAGREKAAQNQKPVLKIRPSRIFECTWLLCNLTEHGSLSLCISITLLILFCPLHFIQQGIDLKFHHIICHFWKQERHRIRNCFINHHRC